MKFVKDKLPRYLSKFEVEKNQWSLEDNAGNC